MNIYSEDKKMRLKKEIKHFLVMTFIFMFSAPASATLIVSQVGVDNGALNAVDYTEIDTPATVSWGHNYTSGITAITSAFLEIDINHPGGVFDAPMEMFIDGISLGDSSTDRTGADILHSFDLVALGLTGMLDGSNTLQLAPYTFNAFHVDFSRLTITGTVIATPEPTILTLLGLGLVGLGIRRRRSRI